MNKTAEFLNECKKKLEISSTYGLAKYFGVDESALNNYYAGRRIPDEYACFKIAEILEIDPALVIARIRAETEKNEKKRDYFKSFGGISRTATDAIMRLVLLSFICLGGFTANGGDTVFLRRSKFV